MIRPIPKPRLSVLHVVLSLDGGGLERVVISPSSWEIVHFPADGFQRFMRGLSRPR